MKFQSVLPGLAIFASLLVILPSCKKDGLGSSQLTLYLTDSPASFDALNIEILRIEINTTDDLGEDNWQVVRFNNPGIYNLLDFTNGIDTMLSSSELKPGRLAQIRLILGPNNSIVVDGTLLPLPLSTPSILNTGLKLNVHADLKEGQNQQLWIDFDAARSIIQTGTGEYKLKPVVRTFNNIHTGAMKGNIQPLQADAVLYAISGADTISAIPNRNTGNFLIRGLQPGSWKLLADAGNGYLDDSITGLQIHGGMTRILDTLTLRQ
jgi:hypothetical protein